jgi:penicillin amidase
VYCFLTRVKSDWNSFVGGVKLIQTMSLNCVFADQNNIGYYVSGRAPIRKAGDGTLPVSGGMNGPHLLFC